MGGGVLNSAYRYAEYDTPSREQRVAENSDPLFPTSSCADDCGRSSGALCKLWKSSLNSPA